MKNILVIEEDPNLSHLLCQFLRNNNFHVIEAANPTIGSSLVRDQYPDLVICSFESLAFDRTKRQTFEEICDTFRGVKIPWILLVAETNILNFSGKIALSEVTILKKPLKFHLILSIICTELNQIGISNTEENRSILNYHHYDSNKLRSLLNYGRRTTHGKLRRSSKASKPFTFLSRRCCMQIKLKT